MVNQPNEEGRYGINWKIFKQFMRDERPLPADKLIILALLFRTGNKNYCWPSHGSIARDTGFSRRYVRARLNKLKEFGVIDVKRGGHNPRTGVGYRSNTYYLNKFLYINTDDKES